jgi:hypothetical protein
LEQFASDDKYDYPPEDGYHPLEVSETTVGTDNKERYHWFPGIITATRSDARIRS